MGRIVYFDFAAFIILSILLFSLFFRKMTRGRIFNTYIALLLVLLISTFADALSTSKLVAVGDIALRNKYRIAISTVYFIFRVMAGPIYIIFVGHLTGTWYKLKKNMAAMVGFVLPYLLLIILLIYNWISHSVFSFEPDGTYIRGPLMSIIYAIGIFYMVYAMLYLILARKYMDREKLFTMLTIFPFTGIAMLVQFLVPKYLLEMFAYSITAMLINIIILRPEETYDAVSGSKSYRAFHEDIQKYYRSYTPCDLIFVRVKNSTALLSILGNAKHQLLQREIASMLRDTGVKVPRNHYHDVYSLYNGLFVVMIDGKKRSELVMQESRRIFDTMKQPFHFSHLDLDLDISVCTVKCPTDIDNYEELNDFANSFHYNIPDDRVIHLSDIAPEKQYQIKKNIDDIISRGIINQSFTMYYQPIYSVKEQRFTTAEALIRLFDEENGMVSPAIFIPSAEKSGAIHKIGEFVVESVCGFISGQDMEKLGLKYVEINLSAVQCMRNSIVTKVSDVLQEYKVKPAYVNFEITETASDFVHDTVKANVSAMHENGLEFALDDYGTGYSNLQRMIDFPFKLIKLDKRFVDEWEDPTMRRVIQNTIRMLKDIGKEIVVEGVETAEEAAWFSEQNCDYIQGFYYARPMPKEDFLTFIREKNGQPA